MIELGEEQKTAFDSIKTFIKEQNNSAYLLTGAAGVGKSYLIKYIVDWLEQEGIQYQSDIGVTTFQTLARLQGILIDLCYELKIPCKICHTKTWKAHCGVKGRSRSDQKKSMQNLVKNWFDVSVEEDEADAIGIGKYVAENFLKRTEIVDWE